LILGTIIRLKIREFLVCRQGRIVEEFSPAEATEERIMYAAGSRAGGAFETAL
jgi:hypothetical protein